MEQIINLQYEIKNSTHISFQNKDGKMWTVPLKNMKVALCVYEPSGIKGKIIKSLIQTAVIYYRSCLHCISDFPMNK